MLDTLYSAARICLDVALPDDKDPPAQCLQRNDVSLIARNILLELVEPEFNSCGWGGGEPAGRMAMPEAAMHKDNRGPLGKHDIGSAR